ISTSPRPWRGTAQRSWRHGRFAGGLWARLGSVPPLGPRHPIEWMARKIPRPQAPAEALLKAGDAKAAAHRLHAGRLPPGIANHVSLRSVDGRVLSRQIRDCRPAVDAAPALGGFAPWIEFVPTIVLHGNWLRGSGAGLFGTGLACSSCFGQPNI